MSLSSYPSLVPDDQLQDGDEEEWEDAMEEESEEEEEGEEGEEERKRSLLWGSEFEPLHSFGAITQISRTGGF